MAVKTCLVISTVPDERVGRQIARRLLRSRVCACVNVIRGISSFYWWKGKIDSSKEAILFIKTTKVKFPRLASLLEKIHPYEVPEIIALDIQEGRKSYVHWIQESLK
ncbi:MAG: divalent-cation tolerance protein CutA [Candidatus Omnitrophica bacterium]|nr:divalent-cation tolerance protein CutA [Candidatus Omnitrophota bacterium]